MLANNITAFMELAAGMGEEVMLVTKLHTDGKWTAAIMGGDPIEAITLASDGSRSCVTDMHDTANDALAALDLLVAADVAQGGFGP